MQFARRAFLTGTMAGVAAPYVLRLARADAPQFRLKLHHAFSAVSSGHDKFIAPWARKVETDSGGRIRIELFPSMQLGGAPAQLFDQVRDGIVDIVWAVPSNTPGRFPKIEIFELPFVPSRRALVSSKAIEDYAAANLKDEFREIHPICFSCSDRGIIHTNRPIESVADIKGLHLHVQTRSAGEAVRILGGRPVTMPSAQLPVAISQHVIDGCIDPWDMVPGLKLGGLLKTHTDFADVSFSSTTLVLAMNKAVYERLPADLKTVVDNNSGQVAASAAGSMWDVQATAVADRVSQSGEPIITLLPEAVAHWRSAVEPVIQTWLRQIKQQKADGGKLLASAHALLEKYANEPEPPSGSQTQVPAQGVSSQPNSAVANAGSGSPAKITSPRVTPSTQIAVPASPVATNVPAAAPASPLPQPPVATNTAVAATPKPVASPVAPPPSALAVKPALAPAAPSVQAAPAAAPPKVLDIPL
jgi:TRAP-type C4-dicarboxylate transport system substrate-binding protein